MVNVKEVEAVMKGKGARVIRWSSAAVDRVYEGQDLYTWLLAQARK